MSKYILFPYPDITESNLGFIFPTPDFLKDFTIEDVAKKDVPKGLPYKIVDVSEVPFEYMDFFPAWEFDFSNPDGYGLGYEDWAAEKAINNDNN